MKFRLVLRAAGAVVALVLLAAVLHLASPAAILELLSTSRLDQVALAAALAALTILSRSLRLMLLLPPGRLRLWRAAWVVAAAQMAATFIPARLGELTLPVLLERVGGWDKIRGLATLFAARLLDLAALGVWAALGIATIWGRDESWAVAGALLLLTPVALLPLSIKILGRFCRSRRERGPVWAGIADRVDRLHEAMTEMQRRPRRALGAALASLTTWGCVWLMTWQLMRAMGLDWPLSRVAAGSALASLANIVPVNLVANIGTLEAGWTAAFTALGYPLEQAAASGVAAHVWALVFVALYGSVAWLAFFATGVRGKS